MLCTAARRLRTWFCRELVAATLLSCICAWATGATHAGESDAAAVSALPGGAANQGAVNTGEGRSTGALQREQDLARKKLENDKLRAELRKLELENQKLGSAWHGLSANAAFITALVALAGVFITVWKQINENRRREEEREAERRKEREARRDESQRELLQRFSTVVDKFGSDSELSQASAAISILSFLKSEHRQEVFAILQAALKLWHSDDVQRLLVSAFERAARVCIPESAFAGVHPPSMSEPPTEPSTSTLNLSRSYLERVDLSRLDLREVDLAFAAMTGADLTGADLFRARGWRVELGGARLSRANAQEGRFQKGRFRRALFHGTLLISTDLKRADLRGAQFQEAKLQSAHLEGAKLLGARFEKADLNDAFFHGAQISGGALKSIVRAHNWTLAHFDSKHREQLDELARVGARPKITDPVSTPVHPG